MGDHVTSLFNLNEGEVVVSLVVTSGLTIDFPVLELDAVESRIVDAFEPCSTTHIVTDEIEHTRVDEDPVASVQYERDVRSI